MKMENEIYLRKLVSDIKLWDRIEKNLDRLPILGKDRIKAIKIARKKQKVTREELLEAVKKEDDENV